jgi:hypothetical protein
MEETSKEQDTLFEDSQKLDIFIPDWVAPRFANTYKLAYLQVKRDPEASKQSAYKRKITIMNLMEQYEKVVGEALRKKKVEVQNGESNESSN